MKKIHFLAISVISSSMLLSGCSSNTADSKNPTSEETAIEVNTLEGFEIIDLGDNAIDAKIQVPSEDMGQRQIEETPAGELSIMAGKNFQILITPGADLAMTKIDLAEDLVYKATIIEESDNYILFSKTIADAELEPTFHFYYVAQGDGIEYGIMDNSEDAAFKQIHVEKMLEAAKTFKIKSPA